MEKLQSGLLTLIVSWLSIPELSKLDSTCRALRHACRVTWNKRLLERRIAVILGASDLERFSAREKVLLWHRMNAHCVNFEKDAIQSAGERFDSSDNNAADAAFDRVAVFYVRLSRIQRGVLPEVVWNDFVPCLAAEHETCTLSMKDANLTLQPIHVPPATHIFGNSNAPIEANLPSPDRARQIWIRDSYCGLRLTIASLTFPANDHCRPEVDLVTTGVVSMTHRQPICLGETTGLCLSDFSISRHHLPWRRQTRIETCQWNDPDALPGICRIWVSDVPDEDFRDEPSSTRHEEEATIWDSDPDWDRRMRQEQTGDELLDGRFQDGFFGGSQDDGDLECRSKEVAETLVVPSDASRDRHFFSESYS